MAAIGGDAALDEEAMLAAAGGEDVDVAIAHDGAKPADLAGCGFIVGREDDRVAVGRGGGGQGADAGA